MSAKRGFRAAGFVGEAVLAGRAAEGEEKQKTAKRPKALGFKSKSQPKTAVSPIEGVIRNTAIRMHADSNLSLRAAWAEAFRYCRGAGEVSSLPDFGRYPSTHALFPKSVRPLLQSPSGFFSLPLPFCFM